MADTQTLLHHARAFSPWLARQLDAGKLNLAWLEAHLPQPLTHEDFAAFADWSALLASADEDGLARSLRVLRRHVMAHLMVRDLAGAALLSDTSLASGGLLQQTMHSMTEFADFAINTALSFAQQHYLALYGRPMGRFSGSEQALSVVAMGKAGGFELNVSSDIDLIFIYPENGETEGRRSRSNQEFFIKVGQKLIALLDEVDGEGRVFRVDMRLRPDGDSGPLVLSEAALEQYLIEQGREWERYAWCKARIVTPHANDIAALVRPFVFRKYLDYSAYEAMRALHRQICQEVSRKGMVGNIKLGAGGIREVEFIAQIFQMIRGGQNRALQLKGTQETLHQLAEHQIIERDTAEKLLAAYRFLRDTEHRLQYWDDQQTQTLPDNPEQQQALAQSMGLATYSEFLAQLDEHRDFVHRTFLHILQGSSQNQTDTQTDSTDTIWLDADEAECAQALQQLGFQQAADTARQLTQLKQSSRYRRLSPTAQSRFDALVPQLAQAAASCADPDSTFARLLDFLQTISRRPTYLAFLQQYPRELQRTADLMSQSAWLAAYLQAHPVLLDELLSAQLYAPLDWPELARNLEGHLKQAEDTEHKMDILRHFAHAQTFRLAVQDLAGQWRVEAVSDELSLLADTILEAALRHVWQDMPNTHRDTPQFAIIGYGKLGGKELGYTSDLDLVFLYDDPHPEATDHYAKLARRLNTWLSSTTGAGVLYETDLRLRPNGDAGFIVHSLAAFEKYQSEQAWTWEHQALSRARFICGDVRVGAEFEAIRRRILAQHRPPEALKADICAMRQKIAQTHPMRDDDVKYAQGGIVDVEFIVQYLVLQHAAAHPALMENFGNIALLNMAASRGLIDPQAAERTASAYRHYRQIQHDKKLHAERASQISDIPQSDYDAVCQLKAQIFG